MVQHGKTPTLRYSACRLSGCRHCAPSSNHLRFAGLMTIKRPSARAHPLIHFIWLHARESGKSWRQLALEAGISVPTMHRATKGLDLRLSTLEAVLNILGYTLKPTPLQPEPAAVAPSRIATGNGKCKPKAHVQALSP